MWSFAFISFLCQSSSSYCTATAHCSKLTFFVRKIQLSEKEYLAILAQKILDIWKKSFFQDWFFWQKLDFWKSVAVFIHDIYVCATRIILLSHILPHNSILLNELLFMMVRKMEAAAPPFYSQKILQEVKNVLKSL